MRGRPVAWRRRRIVLLVHYLDVVSRAAIEAAIVPSRFDDHRSASGVAIPAPGRGDPRAAAKQWPCLPGTHDQPLPDDELQPERADWHQSRAGRGLQHLPAKRHAIIGADGRSAKPGMVAKPAWLGPLRCKPVCCSLADYGASTPPTTRSARERAQLR